jgi:hypothetical protein
MEDLFIRAWTNLVGRLHGPMQFRLVLQPLAAVLLAIRAGRRDAREGRHPYGWALIFGGEDRRALIRSGVKDILRVFVFAIVIDVVYQVVELRWVYPGESLVVAFLLAVLPYVALRAWVNRFLTAVSKRSSPRS